MMMRKLMRSHERRETKRNIGKLSVAEVRAELTFNGCSCTGPEATLRERLLRAVLKVEEPGNTEIPWYPWDDVEDVAPQDAAPVVSPREQVEREQVTARDSSVRGRTGCATTASSSGEDEPQRADTVRSESALIHVPPTSTITVSAPIMTATMVTPSCGTRPTVGVTRAFRDAAHAENGPLAGGTRTPYRTVAMGILFGALRARRGWRKGRFSFAEAATESRADTDTASTAERCAAALVYACAELRRNSRRERDVGL